MRRQFGVDVAQLVRSAGKAKRARRITLARGHALRALPALLRRRLRLQILLQDRHLDREAAIVGEHHADEFIARVQVG